MILLLLLLLLLLLASKYLFRTKCTIFIVNHVIKVTNKPAMYRKCVNIHYIEVFHYMSVNHL